MAEQDPPLGEQTPKEPNWETKIVELNEAFSKLGIDYAFGGAIALNYHREPRSTLDIDINVFLPPDSQDGVVDALAGLYGMSEADKQRVAAELAKSGQTRSAWGNTYVDLFFSNTEFHDAMAKRVEHQPFADTEIPVLSIEDLLVCKVLYDRPKDWVDIEAVSLTEQDRLDRDYVRTWVKYFLDDNDPKLARLEEAFAGQQE